MSEEYEVHIKTYDEWLKYYKNATKEQVIEDLTRDVQYFADAIKDIKNLQQKVEQLENIRKETIEYIENNSYFESNIVKKMVLGDYSSCLLNILKKGSE